MEIRIPDIGDFTDVPVIEVHVSPGSVVAAEDPLVTLESDKATMDVPSPVAGTIAEVRIAVGDQGSEGGVVATLEGGEQPAIPAKERVHEPAHPEAPEPAGYGSPAGVYERLEVRVPDLGDFENVPVIEILVTPGDRISAEDPLLTLESDKATMDVPAPAGGTVAEVRVAVGDTVSEGDVIVELETGQEAAPTHADPVAAHTAPAQVQTVPVASASAAGIEADVQAEVLVLGAGPGGYSAAFRAADLGKSVVKRLTNGLAGLAKQRKVKVVTGYGTFASPNHLEVRADDGSTTMVGFEQAIIAAGSEPVTLPFIPHDDPRGVDSTGALELDGVPERLLGVGGG